MLESKRLVLRDATRPIWRHVQQERRLIARPRQRRDAASERGHICFDSQPELHKDVTGRRAAETNPGTRIHIHIYYRSTGPLGAMLHARTTSHVPAAPRQFISSTGFPGVIGPRPKRRRKDTLLEKLIDTHMLNGIQRANAFSAYAPDSVFSPPAAPAMFSRAADLNAPWSAFQDSPEARPEHGRPSLGCLRSRMFPGLIQKAHVTSTSTQAQG